MKKVNIGFDIGITSIGWAIVDEENNIVDRGVRLFEEPVDKDGKLENQTRREKRGARRVKRRRMRRKADFRKMICNKYQDIFGITDDKKEFFEMIGRVYEDVNDLRFKGLSQELTKGELLKVLYYYLSHRGYTYLTQDKFNENEKLLELGDKNNLMEFCNWMDSNKKWEKLEIVEEAKKYICNDFKQPKNVIAASKKYRLLKIKEGKLPIEIQMEEIKENGYKNGLDINSIMAIFDYKREIEVILKNQSYLPAEFGEDYYLNQNSVFSRLREYSKGPGSKKSPSPFGLFRRENGEVVDVGKNLWDVLIGKCSVYPDKIRALKNSVSAELSNFLNQLNNLQKIGSGEGFEKLTEIEKKQIFEEFLKKKASPINLKRIRKIFNCNLEEIKGYPKNKSQTKDEFESMKNSIKIINIFKDVLNLESYDNILENIEFFDKIIEIFAKNKDNIEQQKIELKTSIEEQNENNKSTKIDDKISNEIIDELIKANFSASQTTSMSLQALREHLNDEIKDFGKTTNQLYQKMILKNQSKNVKDSKYINVNIFKEDIIPATTRNSFRELIKVFNQILKTYIYSKKYELKNIVLEMPNEWNSKEEKKAESERQINNEKWRKVALDKGYDGDDKTILRKIKFWVLQDGKDLYDGEPLDLDKVINEPEYTQEDHIIPKSVSFDNSMSNMCLTKWRYNKNKKEMLLKNYLGRKYNELKEGLWKRLYMDEKNKEFYNPKKYENLTVDNLEKGMMGFIGRNLVDTRRISKMAKNVLANWVKIKQENDNDVLNSDGEIINVLTVSGGYSQQFRSREYLGIGSKDRKENYHHAMDASICAILGNASVFVDKVYWFNILEVSQETGEIIKKLKSSFGKKEEDKFLINNIPWNSLGEKVGKIEDIRFSFKIKKKGFNFGLWGESVYAVKKNEEKNYFLQKEYFEPLEKKEYKDIKKKYEAFKKYYNENNRYPNPKIWNALENIWKKYESECQNKDELKKKNPFRVYMEEMYNEGLTTSTKHLDIEASFDKSFLIKKVAYYLKIDQFVPINKENSERKNENKSFGAYSDRKWKEIWVYKLPKKDKFQVVAITSDLIKYNRILKKFEINEEEVLSRNPNVKNCDFVIIHKNSLIMNKNGNIERIVSHEEISNRLYSRPINKYQEKPNRCSINVLMKSFDFINIDVLGKNISKIDLKKEKL